MHLRAFRCVRLPITLSVYLRAIANHFVKALKIDPKYADAWYNKGTVLYNLVKYNEAYWKLNFRDIA
jgi:tetratricopeptide (TPR) repeat protein